MRRTSVLFSCLLTLSAVALAATTYTVQWNGRAVPGGAIVQGGKTYVSVDALKAAGIGVTLKGSVILLASQGAEGGANQIGAVEGCLNQPLFNGVWRLRVLDVKQEGTLWRVRLETRNGTAQAGVSTGGSGGGRYDLQLGSGRVIGVNSSVVDLRDRGFLPGEALTVTLDFETDGAAGKPMKLVVPIDPQGVANTPLKYSVKDPSFRVNLSCRR